LRKGLGCVLMQQGKVITYASRQLKTDSWRELSGARPQVSRYGIRLKNMETVFVQVSDSNLY
jgi:hypothetical protein